MGDFVKFQKHDGKVNINNLEILEFIDDAQRGGQGLIAFAANNDLGGRLETIKFYGIGDFYETPQNVFMRKIISNSGYWKKVLERGKNILARVGSNEFPKFPMPISAGEYNSVLYMTMSCGRESEFDSEGFSLNEYRQGRLITLDQVIRKKTYGNSEKRAAQLTYIKKMFDMNYKDKTKYFIDILKNNNILHKAYGLVHNDMKPSQILLMFSNEYPRIQTIDLDMYIDVNSNIDLKSMNYVTTLMYNSSILLKSCLGLSVEKVSPFSRDIWSLGLIGQEFILGAHPYRLDAELLMEENNSSKSIFESNNGIENAIRATIQAQEIYFDKRKRSGYTNSHTMSKIPYGLEKILHKMVSYDYINLDNVIEDLLPFSSDPGEKISRRRFIKKISLTGVGAALIGWPSINIWKNIHSAKHSLDGFMEDYSHGNLNRELLSREFLPRYNNEKIVPFINRVLNSGGKVPEYVNDGKYQLVPDYILTAGFFHRMMLLSYSISKEDSLREKYLSLIMKMKPVLDVGVRVFRFTNPLSEFVNVAGSLGVDVNILSDRRSVLSSLYDSIIDERMIQSKNIMYLEASSLQEYANMVRIADYYLIKGMGSFRHAEYLDIIHTLKDYLIFERDNITGVYDAVHVESHRPGIDYEIPGKYDKSGTALFGSSISQVLMIDILNDAKIDGLLNIRKKLSESYLKSIMRGRDIVPRNFIDAPIVMNDKNNMPYSLFVHGELDNNLTGKKDDLIIDLLRKINTDESEGIMPNSMVEAKDPQTYNMMSDYYTLDAIRKFAFNE